jgi:hypothetical protein
MPRVAAASLAVLLSATALTGCAGDPPKAQPEPSASGPALATEQSDSVLAEINTVLAAASEARDPAQLAGRLTGPALAVRTSQLQVAATRDNNDLVTDLPDSYQQIIIPTTESWPRTAYAITVVTDELQPPRLLALRQNSARDNYMLWAWVQLQPGVQMPAFADRTFGSDELAPDDASLRFTPQDAVNQYADLLANGSESAFVDNFEPADDDQFRTFMASWISAQQQALQGDRVNGTYTITVAPMDDTPVLAVRTADGGAMVMAALTTSEQMEAMEGATLTPQTKTAQALLQGQNPNNRLSAGYVDMIALFVPAAGSSAPVRLLGYSHVQTSASVG